MIDLHENTVKSFSLLFTPKKGSGRAMHGANNLRRGKEEEEEEKKEEDP